jgi:hypothetical protein
MAAVSLAACAGPSATRTPANGWSLIEGPIVAQRIVADNPACADPEAICLDTIFIWRIDARTLAGPEVPSSLSVEVAAHGPPRREFHVLLLVRRDDRKPWDGIAVGAARPGEEACVDEDRLHEIGIALPGRRRSGARACYRI